MPSIFDKIQAKLEVLRLEKRYTRQRHRRSTFISNAVYVDGEYVYQTPYNTGSSTDTNSTTDMPRIDALHGEKNMSTTSTNSSQMRNFDEPSPMQQQYSSPPVTAERKRLHRFSSVPRFSAAKDFFGKDKSLATVNERRTSLIR